MVTTIGVLVGVGLVVAALVSYWPRAARPLHALSFAKLFSGLILFGRDQSFVRIAGPRKGQQITMTKRMREDPWWLEMTLEGHDIDGTFESRVTSQIEGLGGVCELVRIPEAKQGAGYAVSGPCLRDPASLEAVARLVIRSLGYSPTDRFRIDFEGPKDYRVVDDYFRSRS